MVAVLSCCIIGYSFPFITFPADDIISDDYLVGNTMAELGRFLMYEASRDWLVRFFFMLVVL